MFPALRTGGAALGRISSAVALWRTFSSQRTSKVIDMADRDGELRVFLVAGELSGDSIASRLMASLVKLSPYPVRFAGVGGPLMQREGLSSLFPMEDISVMGIWELLPHICKIRVRLKEAIEAALLFRPHAMITIDIKGFSFRLLRQLKARSAEIENNVVHFHYVAPSFWAWKGGESGLSDLRQFVDHMLCILPFEEAVCRANGLAATYVGHPLLEEIFQIESNLDTSRTKSYIHGGGDSFRLQHRISPGAPVISLLPGSRLQEVRRMLPAFSKTVEILNESLRDLSTVILVAPNCQVKNYVDRETRTWPVPVTLVSGLSQSQKFDAFSASRAALCASGTAVLELLLARLPCVVAYRAHFVTEWFVKRRAKVRYISLPNILLDSAVVPELLFEKCTSEHLAASLWEIMHDEPARNLQAAAAMTVAELLSPDRGSCSSAGSVGGSGGEEGMPSEWRFCPSMIAASTILYTAQSDKF